MGVQVISWDATSQELDDDDHIAYVDLSNVISEKHMKFIFRETNVEEGCRRYVDIERKTLAETENI